MAKKKAKTAAAKPKKSKKSEQPKTTAQQLAALIKSARDIMRKDKGLNGDLDRLPLLTWIMFLKFLDDREKLEEARAGIGGKKYKPAVEAPYRWRDWAATKDGITGDELIAFINQEARISKSSAAKPRIASCCRRGASAAAKRNRFLTCSRK